MTSFIHCLLNKNRIWRTILKKRNESQYFQFITLRLKDLWTTSVFKNLRTLFILVFTRSSKKLVVKRPPSRHAVQILFSACRHAINFLSITAFSFLRENLQVFWRHQIPLSVESNFEIFVLTTVPKGTLTFRAVIKLSARKLQNNIDEISSYLL